MIFPMCFIEVKDATAAPLSYYFPVICDFVECVCKALVKSINKKRV